MLLKPHALKSEKESLKAGILNMQASGRKHMEIDVDRYVKYPITLEHWE